MHLTDLLGLIFYNLARRKGRVALTAMGVLIGTAAVVILVSLAIGLQQSATSNLGDIAELTTINVNPGYSEGPILVEGGMKGNPGGPAGYFPLTPQAISDIVAIPGVASIIPMDYLNSNAWLVYGKQEAYAMIMGVATDDLSKLGYQAQVGELSLARGQIIIGGYVLQNFYDPRLRPGQTPSPQPTAEDLVGQTIKFVATKYTQDGIELRKTYQMKVVGITPQRQSDQGYAVFLSMDDAQAINEWATGRRINRNKDGYNMLKVKASDSKRVVDIADQITAMGYSAYTSQSYVEGINSFFLVLQVIFGGVGAVALLVAAIGIANTMAMAILERTREIGIMKAVGATNRDVLSVFLGEAAGIGFIGGLTGTLLGWAAGYAINIIALAYLAQQAAESGGMPPPTVAVFTPLWLPPFALLFATLVGLISGLYPALRAATLVPVTALKYE